MFHAWYHIRCEEMGMELASLLGFKNTPAWSWSHSLSGEDVSMDWSASFKMARELSGGRVFLFTTAISFPFFTDESVSLSLCRSSGTVLHPQRGSEKGKIKKQKYRLKPPSNHKRFSYLNIKREDKGRSLQGQQHTLASCSFSWGRNVSGPSSATERVIDKLARGRGCLSCLWEFFFYLLKFIIQLSRFEFYFERAV